MKKCLRGAAPPRVKRGVEIFCTVIRVFEGTEVDVPRITLFGVAPPRGGSEEKCEGGLRGAVVPKGGFWFQDPPFKARNVVGAVGGPPPSGIFSLPPIGPPRPHLGASPRRPHHVSSSAYMVK